jgi:hypothetical protein
MEVSSLNLSSPILCGHVKKKKNTFLTFKIAGQTQSERGNNSSTFTNNDVGAQINNSSRTGLELLKSWVRIA